MKHKNTKHKQTKPHTTTKNQSNALPILKSSTGKAVLEKSGHRVADLIQDLHNTVLASNKWNAYKWLSSPKFQSKLNHCTVI